MPFRRLRLRHGLTHHQLGQAAGLTARQIADVEDGTTTVTRGQLQRLATALPTTQARLLRFAALLDTPSRRHRQPGSASSDDLVE